MGWTSLSKTQQAIIILSAVGVPLAIVNKELFVQITPLALLIITALTLYEHREKRALLWAGIVAIVTYVLEALGVATGIIFGTYQYGSGLGPELLGVPLLIPILWVIVMLGSMQLAAHFKNAWQRVLGAAVIAVIFDLLLEQAATRIGYWSWAGVIPLSNYIWWFVIGLFAAGLAEYMKVRAKKTALITFIGQAVILGAALL